ncbi:MAG: hypothetical protein B7Z37_07215 [Verrucomicrobia bacterium 12-59-8]|nr:MAG: hypothetical protein B7Z37_07215 [Verrucomicrobia bacterium 12-59-8]
MAAYGVALIHLAPNTPHAELITDVVRLFPVPFFYAAAIYFTIPKALKRGTVAGALSLSRLVRPYAVWTLFYLLLRWVKNGNSLFSSGLEEWFGFLFLGQSAVHLYFLPLLVFNQIVAASSVLLCSNFLNRRIHTGAACWLAAAFVGSFLIEHFGYFGWYSAFLGGLVYALLGAVSGYLDNRVGRGWAAVVVIATVTMVVLALIAGFGIKLPSVYYLLNGRVFGCCALLVLLRMQVGIPPRWMERLVSCYFGVYLAHHAIEEGMEMVCAKFGHVLTPYDVPTRLGFALVAFCGGILITCMIRLSPRLAFWMLGEKQP